MPNYLHHLKSTFEFITLAFSKSEAIKEEIQNAYKLDRLILDVLTPTIQDWMENYLISNSNNKVNEYLKIKDVSIIESYQESIKTIGILPAFLNLIKTHTDNNERNLRDIQRFIESNPSLNDLKAFDITYCSNIVKIFFNINAIYGYFNEYSSINLRKNKYNEADLINYSRLIRNKFYAHINIFEISNQEFVELTTLIDKIVEKLNISSSLLNKKQNILKHTINDVEQINRLKEDIFKIRHEINGPVILFDESKHTEINSFLAHKSGCLLVSTCGVDLSSLFIQQKLKQNRCLTFRLNIFISIQDNLDDLIKQYDTLVIELLDNTIQNIDLIRHLKFDSFTDIRIILIGKDVHLFESEIKHTKIYVIYDHYSFNSLTYESKIFLLDKIVKFQSKEIKLKDLIGIGDDYDFSSNEIMEIFDSIECTFIAKLIDNQVIEIDQIESNNISKFDEIKHYYIDRTFKRYLLFEKHIQNDEKFLKTNIIVDSEKKYNELIEKNTSNKIKIHYFDHSDATGYLRWIKSTGCVSKIKKHLVKNDKYALTYKEDEFCRQDERLMIITDDPGMGKTTVLDSLIDKSIKKYQVYYVHVNLNNFANELLEYRKNKTSIKKDFMSYLLENFLRTSKLTRLEINLFKLFSKTGKLVILFDGLDEVIDYKQELIEMVRILDKNYNLKRIILTARNHLKNELEDEFGVITYRLIKFDQENQIEFLKKYWLKEVKKYYEITDETETEMAKFAKTLVEKFNQMNDFIGIPLQIRMLAEIFKENINNFVIQENQELNEIKQIIDLENIAQIYDRFLESKFDEKYIFKDGHVIARDLDRYEEEKESYYEHHFEYSFQLIFKRCIKNTKMNESANQKLMKRIRKFGIITQFYGNEPRFLHRSYAEFFIAKQIIAKKLINDQEYKPELIQIFENEKYFSIRKFIDKILINNLDDEDDEKMLNFQTNDISFDLIKNICNENLYFLLKYLIKKLNLDLKQKDSFSGMNAILFACKSGHIDIIKLLIDINTIDINEKDNDGLNALHHAAKNGHIDVVRLLIEHGIDFNIKDLNEKNAIHYASVKGHKDILEFLIEKCQIDINEKDKYGKDALHFASEWGRIRVAEFLIEKNIDINNQDYNGMNSLHYSIMHGHKDLALLLISKGIDIKANRNDGKNALHFSTEMGNLDMIEFLIDLGIDLQHKDHSGLNALHYASEFGHRNIVEWLMDKGLDINEKDSYGKNAFDYALRYGRKEIVEILIEKGIELKKENSFDWSPLHYASMQGQKDIVQLLIDKGLDVREKDRYGKNSLMFACEWGRKDVVELLLESEIDINDKDILGMNALHYATLFGHKELVEILLLKGINKDQKDKNGKNPFYYATSYNRKEISDLLINR